MSVLSKANEQWIKLHMVAYRAFAATAAKVCNWGSADALSALRMFQSLARVWPWLRCSAHAYRQTQDRCSALAVQMPEQTGLCKRTNIAVML